jgi:hypothetical protein
MNPTAHGLALDHDMRDLLSICRDRPRMYGECRRAVTVAGCDLRAAAFSALFSSAMTSGFLAEVGGGRFGVTPAGANALEVDGSLPVSCASSVRTGDANSFGAESARARHQFNSKEANVTNVIHWFEMVLLSDSD